DISIAFSHHAGCRIFGVVAYRHGGGAGAVVGEVLQAVVVHVAGPSSVCVAASPLYFGVSAIRVGVSPVCAGASPACVNPSGCWSERPSSSACCEIDS